MNGLLNFGRVLMKNAMRCGFAALALTGSVIAAQAAGATTVYKAELKGASEVPAA
jgi:hypothetical protein